MPITIWEIVLRMAAAILLGGAIGYERELREQPAGLRTHLLVSLAAATFMMVSSQFVFFQHYANNGLVRVDPSRIASNVVVGIGFLGGGAIIHAGIQIKGLTTAASLWLVASVGLAAGSGMYLVATLATAGSLFALVVLRYVVEEPRKQCVRLQVRAELQGELPSKEALEEFLSSFPAMIGPIDFHRNLAKDRSCLRFQVRIRDDSIERPLVKRLEQWPGMLYVSVSRPPQ